ncbi:DC-STAMP domain-containing protein 2-like [Xenopus laevis]|uniref:DC-STAMP domain-containing protein 2-like n=1 Tax=Xenopus laevis TaxID=8355 RepID=A0A8J1MJ53_XENLA|nr:DC-STAMP domain-containing protein 2-like [Xenopus laevis]
MAFFEQIHVIVFLTLLQIFAAKGKNLIIALAFSLTIQGPAGNILENYKRVLEATSCGLQLAVNQTLEVVQEMKAPVMRALDKIRSIAGNFKNVSNWSQGFLTALQEGMRLREPEQELFDTAKQTCTDNAGLFGFVCGIIDTFRPLCALAGVPCMGPDFVQTHVSRLKDKENSHLCTFLTAADSILNKFKDHFLFNITVIHDFDINASATDVINVAEKIMDEVNASIDPYLEIFGLAQYFVLFFCLYSFIRAALYRRNYLLNDKHDNFYITKNFMKLNELRVKTGAPSLLPLNMKEQSLYVSPVSLKMTSIEKKMLKGFLAIVPYMIGSIFIIVTDFRAYFLLGKAHEQQYNGDRDSSDEEQVELWLEERGRSKRFRKVQNTEEDEDSDSSMELSDADYEYQEQSPSSDSSDEETLDEAFSKLTKMKKKGIPRKLYQRR